MYFLGIDLGSSSIKLALVETATGKSVAVVQQPETEMGMYAQHKGWAEQAPLDWWNHVCTGIAQLKKEYQISEKDIVGIGIAYQMHGLVVVDAHGEPLRQAIIWCDSRAVDIGKRAYTAIGEETCDAQLLNSPANFTASKLRWVKEEEPEVYARIHKFMLPGDFVAYKFSGTYNTTISGLSEGIFWDFQKGEISRDIVEHYGFSMKMFPEVVDTFSEQSTVSAQGAKEAGLREGTPILYRAGDQPNNALSLNVFHPGEVASTGGTSGVVYAITDTLSAKECSRVNNFAHVNYDKDKSLLIGKLLCVNGAGIQYRWLLNNLNVASYEEMNELAAAVEVGSDGLCILPFGNGAERMLLNQDVGTRIVHLNLNRHGKGHLCRAALEGIAFSFVYGMEIMKSDGLQAKVIRAGNDNLYRSAIFSTTVATLIEQEIELYDTTGAIGAARACAIASEGQERFSFYMKNDYIKTFAPETDAAKYKEAYARWKEELELILN
jgi:xylulokinase